MRLIDADPIIEILKRARKDADSPRRDLDLLNLQQLLEFAPEIAPPPNDPLTSEELRGMDGEPVWDTGWGVWGLVDIGLGIVVTRMGNLPLNEAIAQRRLRRRREK